MHKHKCSNAQYGSYNHECGKPAQWAVTRTSDMEPGTFFTAHYCQRCYESGDEARYSRARAVSVLAL